MFPVSVFLLDQTRQSECPNEHPVEVQLKGDLDTYGSFCITIPLEQTAATLTKLNQSNRDWKRRAASDPHAPRNLDVHQTVSSPYDLKPSFIPDNERSIHRQKVCPSGASPKPFPSRRPPSSDQHPSRIPNSRWSPSHWIR